jgi:hypothetical protein
MRFFFTKDKLYEIIELKSYIVLQYIPNNQMTLSMDKCMNSF